ncbi:autophagy Atg28p [Sarocladium implicatum]|nr:autophagy Atg28p [Sarocladium implicatum]
MTSQSFFERFTSSRRSSLLPIHSPPQRLPSEYDLDELEPRPDDRLLQQTHPREHLRTRDNYKDGRHYSPEPWNDRASSVGSASKLKARPPRAMFAGPPPPIALSTVLQNNQRGDPQRAQSRSSHSSGRAGSRTDVLFDHRADYATRQADSSWRGLRRQEKALEDEVQRLLDLQAAGLIAGLGGRPPAGSDFDDHSDAGSSTPTGTFYSTATSKSRMVNSLHIPARSNADGTVIPVRQPKKAKSPGLRAARTGIRKSMLAFATLKAEEDAHIDEALAQRKKALLQLEHLSSRRDDVTNKLHSWEEDEEEATGQELRQLETDFNTLSTEIHAMEEKLVGMRNRRRVVRAQMEDVRNRREAGLSSYKGTLRDVESDIRAVMRHPPIQPLHLEILSQGGTLDNEDELVSASSGIDFIRMIPERRTVDMAREWWQTEIAALEKRKAQIDTEHQALDEGGALWSEVMALVTDFEARLRSAMKATSTEDASSVATSKGKEKLQSQEDVIREQLPLFEKSIAELEGHMQTAESRGWNLLICAVGAELEAFREAQELLRGVVPGEDDDDSEDKNLDMAGSIQPVATRRSKDNGIEHEESDENEVPNDLLVSGVEENIQDSDPAQPHEEEPGRESILRRVDSSDNDVPAEFFAEHDKLD